MIPLSRKNNWVLNILSLLWRLILLVCGIYGAYALPAQIEALLNIESSLFGTLSVIIIVCMLVMFFAPDPEIQQRMRSEFDKGMQIGRSQMQSEVDAVQRELQVQRKALSSQQDELRVRKSTLESEYALLEQCKKDFENELNKKAAPLAKKKSADYIASLLKSVALSEHYSNSLVFRSLSQSSSKELLARYESAKTKAIHFAGPIEVITRIYGSNGEVYDVTLDSCTCDDFKHRHIPCKHMLKLALEVGLLSPNGR